MTDFNDSPELTALKRKADDLGINYHPRIGVHKLRAKIAIMEDDLDNDLDETEVNTDYVVNMPPPPVKTRQQLFTERVRRAKRLVHVNITCRNDLKKKWPGEMFSVGSAKMGTLKRYFPYGVDWHLPQMMVDELQRKTCSVFYEAKGPRGNKITKTRQIKEYAISILDPLTKEELEKLAVTQQASGSIDRD